LKTAALCYTIRLFDILCLYKSIIEMSPVAYAYHKIICNQEGEPCDYEFLEINAAFENYTGLRASEIVGKRVTEVIPGIRSGEFDWIKVYGDIAVNGGSKEFEQYSYPQYLDGKVIGAVVTFVDTTDRKKAEQELRESERSKAVLLSNLPGMAYRCKYDREWTMQFVSDGCYKLTGYQPESLLYNSEISFNSLIEPEYREDIWNEWARVIAAKTVFKYEYPIKTASGETKWVFEQGQGIYDGNGKAEALEGLIIDITERKKKEEEIQYLSYHDFLTDLYNHRYSEHAKKRLNTMDNLPLSVIIGDINGVKLINDAFGHAAGDMLIRETADIIRGCCRKEDIAARTGGDEFSILLPKTDGEAAVAMLEKIKKACEEYNRKTSNEVFRINLSLGFCTKNTVDENINGVIKAAVDYMNKRKLLEHKSSHSAILTSIRATMLERSHETEQHAERLVKLTKKIGMHLNLSQIELDELELLATLHDIGKVGIEDRILNKPGRLNDDEWAEMKKHPEIGYRIAMASPDLMSIAEYILYHHEHWDGTGYPQGLKGEDIPLLSRILAVVDAYDAMTEDRKSIKSATSSDSAYLFMGMASMNEDLTAWVGPVKLRLPPVLCGHLPPY